MPLAFVYAAILVLLGILRLLMPHAHGLLLILAQISAVCLVVSALLELWLTRHGEAPETIEDTSLVAK